MTQLSPHAFDVLVGLKDRRDLCLKLFHQETAQFEIADKVACAAEATATAKQTKEAVKEAERLRSVAQNLFTLSQLHLGEHDGLGEIIQRCLNTEHYIQACESTTPGTGNSSSSTT